MAVLGRLLVSSAERLDLPDFLSVDSYTQGDFKYLMKSFVGDDKPYILKGFDVINPNNAIGTQNISIRVADSIVYYPGSSAGPYFHGLSEGNLLSAPLVPELRKNATNYVYLTLTTVDAAKDTRAFWDPDKEAGNGGEFTQDVNTQTVLTAEVNVSVSSFPENTIPVCKVVVGTNFITSIQDARDMMFRLGSGGLNPNPLNRYSWREEPNSTYSRKEPNTTMSSALDANPFQGGDKNIESLKEWMDAIMSKLAELGGTTYWYESTSVFNLINLFKDALATSIKSKGTWAASENTPGLLVWTEDIIVQSTTDARDTIIRAGSEQLADNEVMYINRVRNVPINSGSIEVVWFNGTNYVNGQLGAFENLSKGDYIKKADDSDAAYLRVEEFYAGVNLAGGVTSPSNALSIKLSAAYTGTSESKQAVYSKGIYLSSDIVVSDRTDPAIEALGGNYYWLALRSDTIMSIASIVTTSLSCNISESDGETAKVTSTAHGLQDGQRVTFSDTVNFNGTYAIEVEDANTFYIQFPSGPFADESGVSCNYATVTTQSRSTVNGIVLESANHGFRTDQKIIISATTNYNSDKQVFVLGNTTFSIPVDGPTVTETSGLATAVNIYVRTDVGPTKLDRGESKGIGDLASENLMSFIGMENDVQTHPFYHNPLGYNTLFGQENYNSIDTDNLTQRVSQLTSMMADKAQDKTIKLNCQNCSLVANNDGGAGLRSLEYTSMTGSAPFIDVVLPSSDTTGTVSLSSPIVLAVNQSAYIIINRNATFSVTPIVVNTDDVPLSENIFVIATRKSDTSVFLADSTEVPADAMIALLSHEARVINQNLNEEIIEGSDWELVDNAGSYELTITADAYVDMEGLIKERNTIEAQTIILPSVGDCAYIMLNRNAGATSVRAVTVGSISAVANISSPDILVIARRMSDGVILSDKQKVKPADSRKLGEISNQLQDDINGIIAILAGNAYDEPIYIIAGAPANDNELTGPIPATTIITLPADSRDSNAVKEYENGKGVLELFLNGVYLLNGLDWQEVGTLGSSQTTFQINVDLEISDELTCRIDTAGGYSSGGGGGGEVNTASNVGGQAEVFKQKTGVNLEFRTIAAGSGMTVTQLTDTVVVAASGSSVLYNIVTRAVTSNIATNEDIVKGDATSGNIILTLPAASAVPGKAVILKKWDASVNTITLEGNGAETIDGMLNLTLTTQYQSVTVVSDGVNWILI